MKKNVKSIMMLLISMVLAFAFSGCANAEKNFIEIQEASIAAVKGVTVADERVAETIMYYTDYENGEIKRICVVMGKVTSWYDIENGVTYIFYDLDEPQYMKMNQSEEIIENMSIVTNMQNFFVQASDENTIKYSKSRNDILAKFSTVSNQSTAEIEYRFSIKDGRFVKCEMSHNIIHGDIGFNRTSTIIYDYENGAAPVMPDHPWESLEIDI